MKLQERGIIVRKTIESDLRDIYMLSLSQSSPLHENISASALADMFMSGDYIMYTSVRKKTVLGFISGKIRSGDAVIEQIIVKEKFRGSGIGSSLLDSFINKSKKAGAAYFFIAISAQSAESMNFFRSRDFCSIDETLLLQRKNE